MGRLYRCLRAVVRAVTPRMTTTWEEPFSGNPSVFVCNHVGAFGPIDMVVKFPLRDEVRVWCNEGIMNRKTCPAYVRQDQHGLAEHLHDVLPRDGQEFDPLPGAYRPEEALL